MPAALPLAYLDTCCLGRPLDALTNAEILAEARAATELIRLIQVGRLRLCNSQMLRIEVSENPHPHKRRLVERILEMAEVEQPITPEVSSVARQLATLGCKSKDGYQVACAIAARCDIFVTVDRALLRRGRVIRTRFGLPVQLPQDALIGVAQWPGKGV